MAKTNKPTAGEVIDQLQKLVGNYENVESAEFLIALDNTAANVLLRHTNRTHTMVKTALDDKSGQLVVKREDLVTADEEPDRTRPASRDPAVDAAGDKPE